MLNGRPLVIELFCGMFGWSCGAIEDGWYAVGFDIEHAPYHGEVPKGTSSRSLARKAASAQIAKIPYPLSSFIARTFRP